MRKERKGFTLIELIMVIVIIGILAAIAIPRFVNLRREARKAQCEGSVGAIRTALSNYYAWYSVNSDHYDGSFPASIDDLDAYFQDGDAPDTPGWTSVGATWDSYYDSSDGTIDMDGACTVGNF